MSTLITIWDNTGSYAMSTHEDQPLDIGMIDADHEYRYSIGTTDTDYADSKIRITNTLNLMRKKMGNRRSVQQVHISNSTEFVTFVNPNIEFKFINGECYMEVMSTQVYTGYTNNSKKKLHEK